MNPAWMKADVTVAISTIIDNRDGNTLLAAQPGTKLFTDEVHLAGLVYANTLKQLELRKEV